MTSTAVNAPQTIRRLVNVDDMRHLGCDLIPVPGESMGPEEIICPPQAGNGVYFQDFRLQA
jgi:hypothetical protein